MGAKDTKDGEPAVIAPPWVRGLDAPPGTAWTRADALRRGDLVSIGDDTEDRSARVVAVEPGGSPGRLRLRLAFVLDGALIVQCSQAPAVSTRYLRHLPELQPLGRVPMTTVEGLALAERIYDRLVQRPGLRNGDRGVHSFGCFLPSKTVRYARPSADGCSSWVEGRKARCERHCGPRGQCCPLGCGRSSCRAFTGDVVGCQVCPLLGAVGVV